VTAQGGKPSPLPKDGSPSLLERAGTAAAGVGTIGPRHPRARLAVQWGLAVLIFGFLLVFVLRQWNRLPDYDWRFTPGWLALSALSVAVFYAAQGELWRFIVRSLGEEIAPPPARAVWGKSLIARYVPTNVLMVVGRVVMAERYGVPRRVTLASMAYELGFGVCTAVIVGAYFVIELPPLEDQPARYAIVAVVPLAFAALHPRVFAPAANFGLRKLGREPLPRAMTFGHVLRFLMLYLPCWAAIGLGVFAFASALHPIDLGDLPYVAAAYPVAFCVAVLTFIVPSGLGTRDAALATALAAVLAGTVATAIAVGFRIFQTAIELAYVGTVAWLGRRSAPGGEL
jgi:glycosyltransferase 2 family protein